MRIALLTHQWPGVRLGGVGAYTAHCAGALATAGHDVTVFTFTLPDDVRHAIPTGVVVREVKTIAERVADGLLPGELAAATQAGGEGVYRMAMATLLCDALREEHANKPFDIIEAPEYEALALPLMTTAFDAPIVTHIHSGSAIARVGGNAWAAASSEQSLIETLELAAIEHADGICAATHRVVNDTAAAYGLDRLPGQEPTIVPLPFLEHADFSDPPPNGSALYIGRLEFLKGAHLLAPAANEFLKKNHNATLRLAGPDTATAPGGGNQGSMTAWIKSQLSPEIADRVIFLGECNRTQIHEELRQCAFVIAPSLFDNYPYVCCEAMSAGRAVITSAGIGAAELVGPAGITFEHNNAPSLANAMDRLWRDRELQLKLGRTAYERMRGELSPEVAIRKRVEMYKQVIARKKNNPVTQPAVLKALLDLTAFVAGVPSKTIKKTPGMRMATILDAAATGAPVQVMLYGAGRHTTRLMAERHLWESKGHRVIGLIDDHSRFQAAPEFLGLPVMSRSQAEIKWPPGAVIVLSTDTFEEQFWAQTAGLRGRGVRVFKLYGETTL